MAKSNTFFNIDMLVLSVLKNKDRYGYEICKLIREISHGTLNIKEGTLYPIVHQLLNRGFISSRDEIHNRRVRVYYHIEPSGIKHLENIVNQFKKNIQYVFDIIEYSEEE